MSDEPFEDRDLDLGSALTAWRDANAGSLTIESRGPLATAGMDPTWVLRMAGATLDAEVSLFHGSRVEVALIDGLELYVRFEEGISADGLAALLDDLAATERGAPRPAWLRLSPW